MSPVASTPSVAFTPSVPEIQTPDKFSDTLGYLHHCLLPGSMLDLFSKQFELVTRSINDHQALDNKRVNNDNIRPIVSPTKDSDDVLLVQLSELEKNRPAISQT